MIRRPYATKRRAAHAMARIRTSTPRHTRDVGHSPHYGVGVGAGRTGGLRGGVFSAWAVAIAGGVAVQSTAHLGTVLGADRIGTIVDLDRSNGLPDLVSTAVLIVAAAGATKLCRGTDGITRRASVAAAVSLVVLTVADMRHDGAHPSHTAGLFVIALVVCIVGLLAVVGVRGGVRDRVTLAVAVCFLAISFFITGLDRFNQWFERQRGDPIAEYQIVAKEGLELGGWAFVALALWDMALRQHASPADSARASRRTRPNPSADL